MSHSIELSLPHISATHALGALLGRSLPATSTLLLEGDLGSGKTTLVQGIGQGLGIDEAIVSPTFALIHEYFEGRIPLYHFDLYRLASAEVAALQPELYWESSEFIPGIVAIEWADRLSYRPTNYIKLVLSLTKQGDRSATISWVGDLPLSVPELLSHFDAGAVHSPD